jgi:hypothetical protein
MTKLMSASRSACLSFLLCLPLWAQNSNVQGIVIDAVTQQPLSGVHVKLVNLDTGTLSMIVYGALSDRTGHFSIAAMPPGAYIPSPEFTGFVPAPPKKPGASPFSNTIEIKRGQPVSDLKIEMVRRALIAGRVLDDAGDPVPYASVQVTSETGAPIPLRPFGGNDNRTNELGEFRLSGPPGKYYLKATPNRYGPATIPDIRTDGSSSPVYMATFYPGAATVERASMIEIAAGEDKNVEIRLVRQVSLTISGIVTGAADGNRPTVYLHYADDGRRFYPKTSVICDATGRFSFTRQQAGAYRVLATSAKLVTPVRTLELSQTDVTDADLSLTPGVELSGTLVFEGDTAPVRRAVRLTPVAQFAGVAPPSPAMTDEHGFFHFTGVPPHEFHVAVEPMPDTGYLKEVTADNIAVKDIDLSRGRGVTLKIVGGRGAGEVSGKIRDREGNVIVGHPLMVILSADPKKLKQEEVTPVGSDGAFTIKGVRPGKYRLLALDILQHAGVKGVEEFQALAEAAEEIEVQPGGKVAKDLTLIDKEAAREK